MLKMQRPKLFGQAKDPAVRELRLILNKVTPNNSSEQTLLLLSMDCSQSLLDSFVSIVLSKASAQKVLSASLASMTAGLFRSIQSSNSALAAHLQAKLCSDLDYSVSQAYTSPVEFWGLLSLDAWLVVEAVRPSSQAYASAITAMQAGLTEEDSMGALCAVFKCTVSSLLLAQQQALAQCETLMGLLAAELSAGQRSKRLQFQLEDLMCAKETLLHPVAPVLRPASPPVVRRKVCSFKRVKFMEESPQSEDTAESEGSDCRQAPPSKFEPIIRTRLRPEHKSKAQGIVRKLLESHDLVEAQRDLEELLRTVALPAVTEVALQVIKFTLLITSRAEHLETCELLVRVLSSCDALRSEDVQVA